MKMTRVKAVLLALSFLIFPLTASSHIYAESQQESDTTSDTESDTTSDSTEDSASDSTEDSVSDSTEDSTSDSTEDSASDSALDSAAATGTDTASDTTSEQSSDDSARILDGVYIGRVDVSGMTASEAKQALSNYIESLGKSRFTLKMGNNTTTATAEEFGLSAEVDSAVSDALSYGQQGDVIKRYKAKKDLEENPVSIKLSYQVDKDAIGTILEDRCQLYDTSPMDASLSKDDNGDFQISSESAGVKLDYDNAVDTIYNYMTTQWKEGTGSIDLPVTVTASENTAAELEEVTDVLGSAETDYSSSSDARRTNIERGTELLNGTTVFPGQEISVTELVVPFEEDNGYAQAPSYESGSVVNTYGGGICQVSTTLYMALIRAEVEITERHNHSMVVSYVKPSMDAAIAEGSKDLKFVNNLERPIYIEGYADGGTVGFTIYGKEYRSEDREVTFESETLKTIEPEVELNATDDAFGTVTQVGTSHTGYEACLWKIVTENGEETKEEFNTSTYEMSPETYNVGTQTTDSSAASAIQSAIDSNSLDKVYDVIDSY